MMLETLERLIAPTPSVSGREGGIRQTITELMQPLVDEINTDALGNLICRKKGSDPTAARTMLVAHMDEIGFIVTFIEENGYLRIAPIGGISLVAAAYSEVVFENGLKGIFVPEAGQSPKDGLKCEKCYIDIGASSREEAEKHVAIGDCCAVKAQITRILGTRVTGRPLDNRAGCACLAEIARKMIAPKGDVYYVFSVQEEVGCRGARPAAFGIAPDVAINFDVTGTGDAQGATPMAVKLGGGAAVKIKDKSVICHQGLVDELLAVAKKNGIAVQTEILTYGGTDTSAVQMAGTGCRAGALSIPCRYIHSGVEMADLADMEAIVSLAVAYLGGTEA